jgi:hypothetical protein
MRMVHPNETRPKQPNGWTLKLLLAMAVLSLGMDTYSLYDRHKLRESQQVTRQMLDARAEIQIILFHAVRDGRKLTVEEDARINQLWNQAEYNQVK